MARPAGVHVDGAMVRARRLERGLTLEELAERAGLTVRTLHAAERGGPCSITTVRALARALGLSYPDLWRPGRAAVQTRIAERGLAPPPPPRLWSGREQETRQLRPWLLGELTPGVCCIAGPSGIGKSALASHLADLLVDDFPDGIAWVRASYGKHAARPLQVQLELADAFGFATLLPRPRDVPLEAFNCAFQEQLWRRRRLLVLDDIASLEFSSHFHTASDPRARCIITTHFQHVASAYESGLLVLDPLSDGVTMDVLRAYVGEERLLADEAGTKQLLEALRGLPRIVHIAGRVLRQQPQMTTRQYADDLATSPLDAVAIQERPCESDRGARRNHSAAASYVQLQRYASPGAWSLFSAISVFDECPFSSTWAAAAADVSVARACDYLDELVDLFLVQIDTGPEGDGEQGESRFRLDTHATWFAARNSADDADALLGRFASYAVVQARTVADQSLADAWASYRRVRSLFSLCLDKLAARTLGRAESVQWVMPAQVPPADSDSPREIARQLIELVDVLSPLFRNYGMLEAGTWLRAAFVAARSIGEKCGRVAELLAHWTIRCAGNVPEGIEWFGESARLYLEEGAIEDAVRLTTWAGRGRSVLGQQQQAIEQFRRCVELSANSGRTGAAIAAHLTCIAVALTHEADGEPGRAEALAVLDKALEHCEGDDQPGADLVRAICHYNSEVIRRAEGAPRSESLDGAILDLITLLEDEPIVLSRVLATAVHFGVPAIDGDLQATKRRLRHLFRQLGTREADDFDRVQYAIGEITMFLTAHLAGADPNRHPFVRGLCPTDGFAYDARPELDGLGPALHYAIEPFDEVMDDEIVALISESIYDLYGASHHIYGDLQDLQRVRGSS